MFFRVICCVGALFLVACQTTGVYKPASTTQPQLAGTGTHFTTIVGDTSLIKKANKSSNRHRRIDLFSVYGGWIETTSLVDGYYYIEQINQRARIHEILLDLEKHRQTKFTSHEIRSVLHPYGTTYYAVAESPKVDCFTSVSVFWVGARQKRGIGNTFLESRVCRTSDQRETLEADMLDLLSRFTFKR